MSTFSQFTGGGVPVGSLLQMWGAPVNPTINGAEYLRSGNLKTIGSYAAFAESNPSATYNVSTVTGNKTIPSTQQGIRYAGTSYFVLAASGNPNAYASTLSTSVNWNGTTGAAETTCNDAVTFGTRLMFFPNTQDQAYYIDGTSGAATGFAPTTTGFTYCAAVNAAGTLGCTGPYAFSSAAASCSTSTNGTGWTQRAASTLTSHGQAMILAWCVPSSTFIAVCNTGYVATTPDGFTYTTRGLITAGATAVTGQSLASNYAAYTNTATMFSVAATVSGVAGMYLVRTTNGVNFSSTLWSALIGFAPTGVPKISTNGTVVIATVQGDPKSDGAFIFQSADSGVTWTAVATPINSNNTAGAMGISDLRFLNGSWVVYSTVNTSQLYTITNFAATHIGIPVASQDGISSGTLSLTPTYIRIK